MYLKSYKKRVRVLFRLIEQVSSRTKPHFNTDFLLGKRNIIKIFNFLFISRGITYLFVLGNVGREYLQFQFLSHPCKRLFEQIDL